MQKLIPALILSAFAVFALNVQAASHAGAAPMKASEPAAHKDTKKAEKKKAAKPAEKKASEPK